MNRPREFIRLDDVVVRFTRWGQEITALDGINLCIEEREWVMLLGPNGSGKTTLLKTIAGRHTPDHGRIMVAGRLLTEGSQRNRTPSVFYVDQNPLRGTAPQLSVFENLYIADSDAAAERKQALRRRYAELLRPVGLHERLDQAAGTLSGGQRQFLALLIARLQPGRIVLLDEPLAALDLVRSRICLEEISRLHEHGKTLVHVSHSHEHGVSLGTRTVVLNDGRISWDGQGESRLHIDLHHLFSGRGHAESTRTSVVDA